MTAKSEPKMEERGGNTFPPAPDHILDAVQSVLRPYQNRSQWERVRKAILSPLDCDPKPDLSQDCLLSTEELSKHLHVTRTTILRFVKLGKLRAYKMGRRNLFDLREVQASLKGNQE